MVTVFTISNYLILRFESVIGIFFGVTPRINYQYKKTNSNIPSMYSTQKNQVFISFEKSF